MDKSESYDFDVMFEIKDKEISALKAIELASRDIRFFINEKYASLI